MEFQEFGRIVLSFGIILVFIGSVMVFFGKIPGIGRLPGDILIKKDGFSFYFPIATSVVISILLTIVLNLFIRR